MKVRVLQHVPFEGLGSIEPWLEERGAEVSYTRFFAGGETPKAEGADMLIAMGGPMSVNDEAELPWLRAEKQLVRDAIAAGIPVLGVCLGAQLIASACGARVYRNAVKEIGWFPIQTATGDESVFRFPPECTVFHWHGETFDLPAGATRLARSEGCENQAFQIGRRVIGLQFHLEMTAAASLTLIEHCRSELVRDRYVQSEQDLVAVPSARYDTINALMREVLAYMTAPEAA